VWTKTHLLPVMKLRDSDVVITRSSAGICCLYFVPVGMGRPCVGAYDSPSSGGVQGGDLTQFRWSPDTPPKSKLGRTSEAGD
jgi:hypothetical protein